jgi:hypothetical protein
MKTGLQTDIRIRNFPRSKISAKHSIKPAHALACQSLSVQGRYWFALSRQGVTGTTPQIKTSSTA